MHHQVHETSASLPRDEVVPERIDVLEERVHAVGDQLGPVPGRLDRSADEPEVLGASVGPDEEPVALVVDRVLVPTLAGRDHPPACAGILGVQDAHLRGEGLTGDDHQEALRARPGDVARELLVLLLEHEGVQVLRRVDHVAPHLVRAQGLRVALDVVDRPAVGLPGDAPGRPLDGPLGVTPDRVPDLHVVEPAADAVDGVRDGAVVRGGDTRSHGEEAAALRHRVEVEEDLLSAPRRWLPAVDRILQALLRARVVRVGAVLHRHRHVGLLDAGDELLEELLLERLGRCHARLGEGVLGREVRQDLRILALVEPEVVVDAHVAMGLETVGALLADGRRSGSRGSGGGVVHRGRAARGDDAAEENGRGGGAAAKGRREASHGVLRIRPAR